VFRSRSNPGPNPSKSNDEAVRACGAGDLTKARDWSRIVPDRGQSSRAGYQLDNLPVTGLVSLAGSSLVYRSSTARDRKRADASGERSCRDRGNACSEASIAGSLRKRFTQGDGFEDRLGHRARAAPVRTVARAQPARALRLSTRSSPTRRVIPSASKRSRRSCAGFRPVPSRSRKRASVIDPARSHSSTRSRRASS
jgi:hypothetical protein